MLSTGVILPRETWSHIAIQLDSDSQTVVVYVDGTQVYSSSISGSVPLASSLTTPSSKMSIILNEESISGKKKLKMIGFISMSFKCAKFVSLLYFDFIQDTQLVDTTLSSQRCLMLKLPLFPAHAISLDQVPLFQWILLLICHKFNQLQHFWPPVSVTVCERFFILFI